MLLTSGQVSLAVSTGVVVIFTFALFLAGYVLQQQTVHSLQAAIRPRVPKPAVRIPHFLAESPNPHASIGRHGSRGPDSSDGAFQEYLGAAAAAEEEEARVDWSRLAHAQVVRGHDEVCAAVMLFGQLHGLRSPARRVLMFPRAWVADNPEGSLPDRQVGTTRRLMKLAARRYGVELRPLEPFVEGADDSLPSSYSLSSLFTLTQYDRTMHLSGPGIIIDSLPLDGLLAFSPKSTVAAVDDGADSTTQASILMVEPSAREFQALRELRAQKPMRDQGLFHARFGDAYATLPPAATTVTDGAATDDGTEGPSEPRRVSFAARTLALRGQLPSEAFNATAFLEETAYVRFDDPELPGPQYEVPYRERAPLRPGNEEARVAWERVYEMFRRQRIAYCQLDLMEWSRPVVGVGTESGGEGEERLGKDGLSRILEN